jgi:DNA primase
LCLDNDQAGIAATERICRLGILSSVGESYPVEFRVARLPETVKDPADYMEINKDSKKLDDKFRREILGENSLEWTDWYQGHILDQYNQTATTGESGNFADMVERLGSFLSMLKNGQDRKKRFRDIVDVLAVTIARESNETEVSETVRLQLEAELKRKTETKTKLNQGSSFPASANSGNPTDDISRTLARMAPSNDPQTEFQVPKKKRRAAKSKAPPDETYPFDAYEADFVTPPRTERRFRAKNRIPKKKPALTPHFSGFEFNNNHDKMWLDDMELTVSLRAQYYYQGNGKPNRLTYIINSGTSSSLEISQRKRRRCCVL